MAAWWRLLPFAFGTILLGLLLCHSWYGPDIWYHLTWGREFIEAGRIWPEQRTLLTQPIDANVYWVFQGAMYLAYKWGGLILVSSVFIAAWLAIAFLWLKLSEAWNKDFLGPWLFLAFVISNQLRFEHRPEVFSYLFVLLFLLWFARYEKRGGLSAQSLAALALMQALWVNMHGYFALGVLIALAWLASLPVRRGSTRADYKQAAVIVGVTALASLASPAPFGVWLSVAHNAQVGTGLKDLISELFPPALWPPYWQFSIFWFLWAVTGALAVRALYRRQDVFAAFTALGGMALSAQAVRNIPLLLLLSARLWRTLPDIKLFSRFARASAAAAALAAVCLSVAAVTGAYQRATGSLGTFGIHLEWASYPIGVVEHLQKLGFKGKIFTDSYDGGYVEFHLPESKIAGDSYFSDPDLTREFFGAIREPQKLSALHQRLDFDALIINIENLEVMDACLTAPEWRLVYSDSHRALFLNRRLHPADGIKLAQSTYYRNENLRDWMYAFGPISWMAVARKYRDRALVEKIVHDVQAAPEIPSTLVKMALGFATDHYDRPLVQAVMSLRPRMYESEDGDGKALADLDEKAKRCCL